MARIGGNITAKIEICDGVTKNALDEDVESWGKIGLLTGRLDLYGDKGGPNYSTYSAPIAESTHIFLSDYDAVVAAAKHKKCRAIIDGQRYDVQLIDDPMSMHKQLEIYLKHTGGQ